MGDGPTTSKKTIGNTIYTGIRIVSLKDSWKNKFGSICYMCDRLWFQNDIKKPAAKDAPLIHTASPGAMLIKF